MTVSTLDQIKKKVRRLTASPSTSQLTDTDLVEYINDFYNQDFPSNLKVWELKTTYEFTTRPNIDQYFVNENLFHTIEQPVYIDGYQTGYNQDRASFFNIWPFRNMQETPAMGDGAILAGPYSFQLFNVPVLANNVTISAPDNNNAQMVLQDDGVGNLIDFLIPSDPPPVPVLRGTINYVTGAIVVTFPNPVMIGANITTRTVPYVASRPISMLYFKDYFILRPVPDKVYRIVMNVHMTPVQFMLANGAQTPQLDRWWQYIAFGSAIKVLQDRLDNDSIASIMPFKDEQERFILYHQAAQQREQRARTIYSENNQGPYDGFGWPGVANGI